MDNENTTNGDFAKYLSLFQSTKLPSFLRNVADDVRPSDPDDAIASTTNNLDNLESTCFIAPKGPVETSSQDQLDSIINTSSEVGDDPSHDCSVFFIQNPNMDDSTHNSSNIRNNGGPIIINDARDDHSEKASSMRVTKSGIDSLAQMSTQPPSLVNNGIFESGYDAAPDINFSTRPDDSQELNTLIGGNSGVMRTAVSAQRRLENFTHTAPAYISARESPGEVGVGINGINAVNDLTGSSKDEIGGVKHFVENNLSRLEYLQGETCSYAILNQNSTSTDTILDETGISETINEMVIGTLDDGVGIETLQNDAGIGTIQHFCIETPDDDGIESIQHGNGIKTTKDEDGIKIIQHVVGVEAIQDRDGISKKNEESILDVAGIATIKDNDGISKTCISIIKNEIGISAIDDNVSKMQDNTGTSITKDENGSQKYNSFIQSKKSLVSDTIVNNLLSTYFISENEEKSEILTPAKPEKPLIAKALLPKAVKVANYITCSSNNENIKSQRKLLENECMEGDNETINKNENINTIQRQEIIASTEFSFKNNNSPKQESNKSNDGFDTHNTTKGGLNLKSVVEDESNEPYSSIKLVRSMAELRRHSTTSSGIALKMRDLQESQQRPVEKIKIQLTETNQEADHLEEPVSVSRQYIIEKNHINCDEMEKGQTLNKSMHKEKLIARATSIDKRMVTSKSEFESTVKAEPRVMRRASTSSDAVASKIIALTSPANKTSNSINNKNRINSIQLPPTLPKVRQSISDLNDASTPLANIKNKESINNNSIIFEEVDSKNLASTAKEYFKKLDTKNETNNKSQNKSTNISPNKNEIQSNTNKMKATNFDFTKTEIEFSNINSNTLLKADAGASEGDEDKAETVEDIIEKYKAMSPNEKIKKDHPLKPKMIPVPSITMLPGKRIPGAQNSTR